MTTVLNMSGDNFVLTRRLNHPELVFNQRISLDSTKERFFKVDSNQAWTLSQKDECYICEKHHYTVIFYERANNCNQGLIEITDQIFLDQLKQEYLSNIHIYKNDTPLICGTIVNKGSTHRQYERKLKMVPASIFSLL